MKALTAGLRKLSRDKKPQDGPAMPLDERLVVAHFMLGNTYSFTRKDWETTFDQAEETGLDGFALNIGREDWQVSQALAAFDVLANRRTGQNPDAPPTPPPSAGFGTTAPRPFRLFLSLDMMVLPSTTRQDAEQLHKTVVAVMQKPDYLCFRGKRILSTFGGQDASMGGMGWAAWIQALQRDLGSAICFWPAFFLPPEMILDLPYVDAAFMWNGGWPLEDRGINLKEDELFLSHPKPYMAAVSPGFFTHYGTEGEWAYNKNWIFRSDDLLLPSRFSQLLGLPPHRSPQIIQVISWNDHGESHAIAPVLGGLPGCHAWTDEMDHVAFREMVRYFGDRWRHSAASQSSDVVLADRVQVWAWYRTHPADTKAMSDAVGRPKNAERARDLLNFVALVPPNARLQLIVYNGQAKQSRDLSQGDINALTLPFFPGRMAIDIVDTGTGNTVLHAEGRPIEAIPNHYNFNFWSGSWSIAWPAI